MQSHTTEEYKESFDRIDSDGSGCIDTREIHNLLREASHFPHVFFSFFLSNQSFQIGMEEPSPCVVNMFLAHFDQNRDGRITFDEFESALLAIKGFFFLFFFSNFSIRNYSLKLL